MTAKSVRRISMSTIQKSMDSKRRMMLRKTSDPKEIRFCTDPLAFEFVCRSYAYEYDAWHGNYPSLSEITYMDEYERIADKMEYDLMMERLKEDYSALKHPETKYLIDTARILRRRYGNTASRGNRRTKKIVPNANRSVKVSRKAKLAGGALEGSLLALNLFGGL